MAARIPPAIRRALAELDAEARAVLAHQPLPAWLALYRLPKQDGGRDCILFRHGRLLEAAQRGIVSTIDGFKPILAVIVADADRLEPAARHILRFWMAERRRRLAVQRKDGGGQRAATALLGWLRAHQPSLDRGARNIALANAERDATRAAEWKRWQAEADDIWLQHPGLSRTAVAELVQKRLRLADHAKSVARRLVQK
jgi:hypothetical protein